MSRITYLLLLTGLAGGVAPMGFAQPQTTTQPALETHEKAVVAGLMTIASQYRRQRKYEKAFGVLNQILRIDPTNKRAQDFKYDIEDLAFDMKHAQIQKELETEARHASLTSPPAPITPNRQLRRRLQMTVPQIAFSDTRLEDVVQFMRDVTKAAIYVQWRELKKVGIKKDTPVNTKLKEVTLETVLRILLDDLSGAAKGKNRLAFTMKGGVAVISTVAGVEQFERFFDAVRPVMPPKDQINLRPLKRLQMIVPQIAFSDTKIEDIVQFLQDVTKTTFDVRWEAMAKAGVTRKTPVTVNMREVTLETTLKLVLNHVSTASDRNDRLDYYVRNGRLVIGTYRDLGDVVTTRRYDVRGILSELKITSRKLIAQLLADVDPPSWRPGSATEGAITHDAGLLIVRQSRDNHERIRRIIEGLRSKSQPATRPGP